ncbi:MAG: hypothetical protein WC749_07685 [Dehalococcoidia bacterium]
MATFGQVIADTLIGTFQGQKYQDDTHNLRKTRDVITSIIRPDVVASVVVPGGTVISPLLSSLSQYSGDRDAAISDLVGSLDDVFDIAKGQSAKVQLQAIIGTRIDSGAPMMQRVMDQMGVIANLSALLSSIGIGAEIASLGQIDRVTDEVRKYLDASGSTQLVNFGYAQILSELLGEPLGQELRSITGHTLLGLNDLVSLQFKRSSFNPDKPAWDPDLADQVRKYGISGDKAVQLLQANIFYPQVQDWIRFSVRDVFNPSAVSAGRYDDGFPDAILEYSRKAGVSDQTVKWFWRAHWELPSPTMGYEMLHRGQITEAELDGLLRLADYAPGWVDKMIAISYQPLTRIDARRLYADGIIDRARYLRAMMDLGYRREDAELFVKWTDEESVSKTKDLTAAQMKKAFGLGLIMESNYQEFLKKQGYDSDEIATLLELDQAEAENKKREQAVKLAQKRYKYKITDEAGLKSELTTAGVLPERIDLIVDETVIEKKLARKLPSRVDLLDWLKKGLITEATALERLQQIGYSAADADLYILAAGLAEEAG